MDDNCPKPCREHLDLEKRFERFREETQRRLAAGDVSMAPINTKLNWLIGILASIGVAVLTAVLKLVTG